MNLDQIQPTLHGDEAPSGVCSRRTGTAPCGAIAVAHAVWRHGYDEDGGGLRNSFMCAEHATEARHQWVYLGLHPYGPACSDPRAVWVAAADRCAVPEALLTDAERASLGEPIPMTPAEAQAEDDRIPDLHPWEVGGDPLEGVDA